MANEVTWSGLSDAERRGIPLQAARKRLDGFPSLAEFIARDDNAAIYRKFEYLSARNLLYLQSELLALESELSALDAVDARDLNDDAARKAARSWEYYSEPSNPSAARLTELQGRIRLKLREYHEALVLESQVLALHKPDSRTLHAFRQWFHHKTPVLWGKDSSLYNDQRDLVALSPIETDRINLFLQKYLGWLFPGKVHESGDVAGRGGKLFYYQQHHVQFMGGVISVALSAVLLFGAVACLLLYKNASDAFRVGMIVLFTSLFATVVGLLTNARRAEIFGATAAYTAVLVVFVSSNIGSTPCRTKDNG